MEDRICARRAKGSCEQSVMFTVVRAGNGGRETTGSGSFEEGY